MAIATTTLAQRVRVSCNLGISIPFDVLTAQLTDLAQLVDAGQRLYVLESQLRGDSPIDRRRSTVLLLRYENPLEVLLQLGAAGGAIVGILVLLRDWKAVRERARIRNEVEADRARLFRAMVDSVIDELPNVDKTSILGALTLEDAEAADRLAAIGPIDVDVE